MGENKLPPDYAYLEQLSMEQLMGIIHADADSIGSGNEDFIFAVLGVIEKRQTEQSDYQPQILVPHGKIFNNTLTPRMERKCRCIRWKI